MPLNEAQTKLLDDKFEQPDLEVSLDRASRRDPDSYASSLTLAGKQDIPVDVVERNKPEVERRLQLTDMNIPLMKKSHPKTSGWLENEDNASVSSDDIDILKGLEDSSSDIYSDDFLDKILRATRSTVSGLPSFAAGTYGIPESVGALLSEYVGQPLAEARVLPEDPFFRMRKGYGELRKGQQELAEYIQGDISRAGETEQAVYSGFKSFGQQAPGLLIAIVTGNPAFLYGTIGTTVTGESITEALDKGVDPARAVTYGLAQGGTELLFEKIPALKLFGDLKAGSSFFKTLTTQLATEIPAEQATTLVQDLNSWAVLNPEKTFNDYLAERPAAAYQTLVATAVGTGLQTGAAYTGNKLLTAVANKSEKVLRDNIRSVAEQKTIDNIVTLAQSSTTRERALGRFKSFVNTLGADREVLIPEDVAAQMEDAPAYVTEQIDGTGTSVVIPLTEFAGDIAPNDEWMEIIRPHIKLTEGSSSQVEITEGATDDTITELLERAQASQETLTEADQVYETVKDQLVATGMQSEQTARHSAALYPARAAVMVENAKKLGQELTVAEAFEIMGFQVQGEQIAPEAEARPGEVLEQVGSPAFKKWFGDSKVIDETGDPLIVYHGTNRDFEEFDDYAEPKFGEAQAALGFFFTPSSKYAGRYTEGDDPGKLTNRTGGNIRPVYLSIQNPKIEDTDLINEIEESWTVEETEEYKNGLISEGYDGIIFEGIVIEHVAFNPIQIKSAVGNIGAFDPTDPRILAQSQDFTGIELTEERIIEETGETVTITQDAQRVWDQTQKRRNVVSKLRDCLNA